MSDLAATTLSADLIPVVADTVAAYGVPAERLLEDGTPPPASDGRITHAAAAELLARAAALTGEDAIGLHVAARLRPGALGLVDDLAHNSATVGASLARASRYQRLLQDADLDVEVGPATVAQTYRLRTGAHLPPPVAECTLGGAAAWLRQIAGAQVRPREVCFAHAPAGDPAAYARLLGAPVHFRCAENVIVFPAGVLAMPADRAHPARLAHLERVADARLAALPPESALGHHLRALVARRLADSGPPRQAHAARALGVSMRTLRRHLGRAGLAYATLVDEVRRARVDDDLAATALALDEIAWRAGLNDASALRKACLRWHGVSPGARRRRLRARRA